MVIKIEQSAEEELKQIKYSLACLGAVIEYMLVAGGNKILYKEIKNRIEDLTRRQ